MKLKAFHVNIGLKISRAKSSSIPSIFVPDYQEFAKIVGNPTKGLSVSYSLGSVQRRRVLRVLAFAKAFGLYSQICTQNKIVVRKTVRMKYVVK